MRIDNNQRTLSESEKLESKRNEEFRNNGIDAKIDKDLNNKRSFAHMTFENPFLSMAIFQNKYNLTGKNPNMLSETLRIYERAIKDNIAKGKLTEKDFLLENVYENFLIFYTRNTKDKIDNTNDFLLSTHGFTYLSEALPFFGVLIEETKLPKEIKEIEKHYNATNHYYKPPFDENTIDLNYYKERIDKLAKNYNLTNKEKSIYWSNILIVDMIALTLLNIHKSEQILNNSKDIDKDTLDLALAYRLNNNKRLKGLNKRHAKDLLEQYNIKNPEKIQEELIEILQRNGLTRTLNSLSKHLGYHPPNNNTDVLKDFSCENDIYRLFTIDHIYSSDYSMFFENILFDFVKERECNGLLNAKNALPDIIDKNFQKTNYTARERFTVLDLLAKPYFFSKSDTLDLSAALSNLYPTINNFDIKEVINNFEYKKPDEKEFEKWITDYAEARLKYGASVLEVELIKKAVNKAKEEIYEN